MDHDRNLDHGPRPLSRRAVLGGIAGGAAAAAIAPTLFGSPLRAFGDTPTTLPVDLVNKSGHGTVWAYVTGTDPSSGRPFFLRSDGRTKYFPSNPSSTNAPLEVDCSIPVASTLTLPRTDGGRLWFSLDRKLTFARNPNAADPSRPGIVMPSAANPNDPNHAIRWGFVELTYNQTELFGNISFVDFVGLPIALALNDGQRVGGIPAGGIGTIASRLRSQASTDGFPWDALIVSDSAGPLRILSPNLAGGDRFAGYLDDYVNRVWQKYSSQDLVIDTQYTWGTVHGRVSNGQLTFPGVASFSKPSTQAIFNCSIAPFFTSNDEKGNISARLAAGFNRTDLLTSATQPASGGYYQEARTNHYSRIVHGVEQGGLGYTFPYDDVHASGGTDVEGKVESGSPGRLTATVGAP